jgi:hypothetical protein
MTGGELVGIGVLLVLLGIGGAAFARVLSMPADVDHAYARRVVRHVRRHGEYHDSLVHVRCDGIWRLPFADGLCVVLDGELEVERHVAAVHRRARLEAEAEALAVGQDGAA